MVWLENELHNTKGARLDSLRQGDHPIGKRAQTCECPTAIWIKFLSGWVDPLRGCSLNLTFFRITPPTGWEGSNS
jgi:hypothetical protein